MYSPDEYEILAEVCSVACITILSIIFGRKVASIEGRIYYIRALLLILYGCSWAVALIGCMLTSTNNGNSISCSLSFFNISLIYTITKIVLYLYWIEKVIIKWASWLLIWRLTPLYSYISSPCQKSPGSDPSPTTLMWFSCCRTLLWWYWWSTIVLSMLARTHHSTAGLVTAYLPPSLSLATMF